jgi:hypothetical protein
MEVDRDSMKEMAHIELVLYQKSHPHGHQHIEDGWTCGPAHHNGTMQSCSKVYKVILSFDFTLDSLLSSKNTKIDGGGGSVSHFFLDTGCMCITLHERFHVQHANR